MERVRSSEQITELEAAALRFLDLLYGYDYVGKDAYFRKNSPEEMLRLDKPLFDQARDYELLKGKKYLWMDAPYLHLGITREGQIFKPKNYWSFGHFVEGGNIYTLLNPDLWGKNIYRVHTRARRGMGYPGESAVINYHDLHFAG